MIPCGRCVVINRDSFPNIDRDNIIELKFARGIEIMGMLYIAGEDIQIKILTPFIRVLGEFHIDAGGVSVNGTPNVELILGDKNNTDLSPMEKFFPPSSNAYACGISRCEPKPKSIFVGGGKLKFRGLSPNTPTSIPLEGVISSTQEKNTTAKKHKCPSGGILFNKPFLDGSNNDTTRKRNLSKTAIKSVDVTGTLSELLNRRRTLVDSDLKIDMTDIKGCLEASSSSDYELVMVVRLIRDGYDGEATLCGTKCIKIFSEYMIDNISIENQVSILKDANQTIALDYGQWSELKTTITFTEEELSTSNIYFGLRIESSDESSIMDISTTILEIDQFRLQLAPEKACGMKTEICRELVPCNGHAEYNYAQMPFSGLGNDLSPIIQYDEKDKNRYWFSKSEGNISWVVPTECLTEDALYSLAMRVRAFREEGDNNTELPIFNYGKPPPAENLPLGLCGGDCDNDGMCAGEMVCFQRESGNEPVRYCKGGTEDNSLTDYCTYPIANVTIRSSETEDVPLLDFCEGDCDTDADCAQGLKCFQRNGNEDVPFCAGGKEDKSRTDYYTHIIDVVSDVDSSIEEENSATVQLLIFLKIQNLDGNVVIKQVADCTGLLDQWVNCYGSFRVGTAEISKNINPNDIHAMYIVATTGTGTNLSYGVDDISVHLSNGGISTPDKVTDLVVSKSIEDYWLPGSEILVSHRMSSENIARRTVFDVEPYDDDRVLISLDTSISSWPPQEWADDQNNVDIILLSRNLAIVDGIITIYRTPTVAQVVQGVEFRRNSTGSQPSSSAVDFDRCEQNEASVLSNNTIFNISSVSSVPTKDTTDSPSEAPTVLCQDDKSFRFKGKKKCRWVGKKSGRRCKRKHLGNFIRKYCPKTCGIC